MNYLENKTQEHSWNVNISEMRETKAFNIFICIQAKTII